MNNRVGSHAKGRVIVADDDANAAIIAQTLLQARGFSVRTAADGPEAWELVQAHGVDIVVLDLRLSGMNGFELIRRLRGRFEPVSVALRPSIVVLSDRTEPETSQFAKRLGADVVLRKPLDPKLFLDAVERLAGSGTESRAAG